MIVIRLDRVLADRKMKLNDLAARVGISNVNLSYLKTGKVRAIRFSTLDAICRELKCQPGDILSMRRMNLREQSERILFTFDHIFDIIMISNRNNTQCKEDTPWRKKYYRTRRTV